MLTFMGGSFLASDYERTSLPDLTNDSVSVTIPSRVWNSFQFKFIDEVERIDPHSERAHGLTQPVNIAVATLNVRYRQRDIAYTTRFRIDAEVMVLPDNAWNGGASVQSVPPQAWSDDNLRADIWKLSCRQY